MKLISLAFIMTLIFLKSTVNAETKNICQSPEIVIANHSINPLNSARGSFKFRYRFLKGQKNAPVVIRIPGGPGESAITEGDPRFDQNIGWIDIDPRNTGCNLNTVMNEDTSTSTGVYDIAQIISEQHLNNYVIFATSYGTVVATELASYLSKKQQNMPKAIILQGIIGHSFADLEQEAVLTSRWNIFRSSFSDEMKAEFEKNQPYGIQRDVWLRFFSQMLYIGDMPEQGDPLKTMIALIANPAARSIILNQVSQTIPLAQPSGVFQRISCSELVENAGDHILEGTKILPIKQEKNMCSSIKLNNPYDSAKFQIASPIFYFAGDQDVATPIDHAQYHFQYQNSDSKTLIQVKNAGHNALTINLQDCYPQLMSEIVLSKGDIEPILTKCKLKTEITHAQ